MENEEEFMTFEKALAFCKDMSKSQGFYGRIHQEMLEWNEEKILRFEQDLIDNKVKTDLDLVYYFEC